jgi:glucose-6-phosphate 1-dehydrogenase
LFAREDAIDAQWRIVEPVLRHTSPVYPYEQNTWGPVEADQLIAPGKWFNPSA